MRTGINFKWVKFFQNRRVKCCKGVHFSWNDVFSMKHSASKLKLLSLKCDYVWSFLFQKIIWWIAVSVQLISQDNFFLNLKIAPTDFKTRKSIICQSSCMNSSVISQKGKSQNWCFKKTKHAKFTKKRTFLTPWYAHVPVLRFALLPNYRRTTCFHVFSENEDKFNGISIGLVYLQFWIVSSLYLIVGKENTERTQLTFTCSKSTIETLEKGVNLNMFHIFF